VVSGDEMLSDEALRKGVVGEEIISGKCRDSRVRRCGNDVRAAQVKRVP